MARGIWRYEFETRSGYIFQHSYTRRFANGKVLAIMDEPVVKDEPDIAKRSGGISTCLVASHLLRRVEV